MSTGRLKHNVIIYLITAVVCMGLYGVLGDRTGESLIDCLFLCLTMAAFFYIPVKAFAHGGLIASIVSFLLFIGMIIGLGNLFNSTIASISSIAIIVISFFVL